MSDLTAIFGDVIYSYSRAQAIEDGVLVDLMQPETVGAIREAGFKFSVACTAEVFAECIDVHPAAERACNDLQGRLWDVLYMLRRSIEQATRSGSQAAGREIYFQLYCVRPGRSIRPRLTALKCVSGPDDNGAPCLTIMFPNQD